MLWDAGLYADIDNGADTLNKKILLGEQAQYNFIFGEPELHIHLRIVETNINDNSCWAR